MSFVLCCVVLSVVSGQEKLENVFFLLFAICVCSSVFCSPPHLPFPFNASTHQLHHLDARFRSVSLGSAYFHSISVRRHVAGHSRVKWIRCACFFCIRSCRLTSSLHILVHGNWLAFLSARIIVFCSVFVPFCLLFVSSSPGGGWIHKLLPLFYILCAQ